MSGDLFRSVFTLIMSAEPHSCAARLFQTSLCEPETSFTIAFTVVTNAHLIQFSCMLTTTYMLGFLVEQICFPDLAVTRAQESIR